MPLERSRGFRQPSWMWAPADWARAHESATGILLLLLLMLIVAIGRWIEFSAHSAPPGSDGGQWLAFGHQLFGGGQVKAGFQTYPPIVPLLVRAFSMGDGLLTLKLVGIASSVLLCVPVFLLLRTILHPWISAILAVTVALNPYQCEILCFGGYPQLLGTAFLVLALYFLVKGLGTGERKWFLATAAASVATAGSNVLPAMVLVFAGTLIMAVWVLRHRHQGTQPVKMRIRRAAAWWVLPSVIVSLPFVGTYFAYFSTAERSPANPKNLTLLDISHWLESAWLWEFLLWFGVTAVAIVAFTLGSRRLWKEKPLLLDAAGALLASGATGLLVLRELRFCALIEIGMVLVAGIVLYLLFAHLRDRINLQFALFTTLVAVVAFVLVVGAVGQRRFRVAYYWYDAVDDSVMPALVWLRENRIPDARVAATGAALGHNYGWWIEGYAHMQTYMAGDPGLFFNEKERRQVSLAHRLLIDAETSAGEIGRLVEAESIRFLFVDKQVIQRPLDVFIEAGFVKSFRTDSIVILEWDRSRAPPAGDFAQGRQRRWH